MTWVWIVLLASIIAVLVTKAVKQITASLPDEEATIEQRADRFTVFIICMFFIVLLGFAIRYLVTQELSR